MADPVPTRHRRRALARVVVVVLGLQLVAGLVPTSALDDGRLPPPASAPTLARAVPAPASSDAAQPLPSRAARTAAVEQLLTQRATALLSRDRGAFLASVDPTSQALRARQAGLFDALAQVPVGSWEYALHPGRTSPPDPRLDRRYGRGRWWAPAVELHYALAGFDERPVVVDQHLTFVLRDGRWLLAADDDFALRGRATPRALWDRGPVVAVREQGVLALGHPRRSALVRDVAARVAAAIPRVTAAWGAWSERVVVIVPDDAEELAGLLASDADFSRIAAVATAELRGGQGEHDPTGQRVLLNPDAFAGLGELGRQVVVAHEVTHVATRSASGPAVPGWLAEGFADLVGYTGVDVSLDVAARDLAADVRAGRIPQALPADADFEGSSGRLSQAYQGAWLALRLLVDQHGHEAVLRFYRAVGARRGVPSAEAVEQALRSELGTSTAALTADWRVALQRQLG